MNADNSGRDFRQFGFHWVLSVIEMPDEEMRILLESHYPRLAVVRREREEHEKASGHSLNGWYTLPNYFPDAAE